MKPIKRRIEGVIKLSPNSVYNSVYKTACDLLKCVSASTCPILCLCVFSSEKVIEVAALIYFYSNQFDLKNINRSNMNFPSGI